MQIVAGSAWSFWVSMALLLRRLPRSRARLTVHLGEALAAAVGRRRPSEDELLAICRLPWFRKGWMPEELRVRLARDIAVELKEPVRQTIASFVSSVLGQARDADDPPTLLFAKQRKREVLMRRALSIANSDVDPDKILLSFMTRSEIDPDVMDDADQTSPFSRIATKIDLATGVAFFAAILLGAFLWIFADEIAAATMRFASAGMGTAGKGAAQEKSGTLPPSIGSQGTIAPTAILKTPESSLSNASTAKETPTVDPNRSSQEKSDVSTGRETPRVDSNQSTQKYLVCIGEIQSGCSDHNVFLQCGDSVETWARRTSCEPINIKLIDDRSGNRCGYRRYLVECKPWIK